MHRENLGFNNETFVLCGSQGMTFNFKKAENFYMLCIYYENINKYQGTYWDLTLIRTLPTVLICFVCLFVCLFASLFVCFKNITINNAWLFKVMPPFNRFVSYKRTGRLFEKLR